MGKASWSISTRVGLMGSFAVIHRKAGEHTAKRKVQKEGRKESLTVNITPNPWALFLLNLNAQPCSFNMGRQ